MSSFDLNHFLFAPGEQNSFQEDFSNQGLADKIVPETRASKDALWGGLADSGPFNPDRENQIFSEYLTNGVSPTADAIAADDKNHRTISQAFNLSNIIKQDIAEIPGLSDITDRSTAKMRAIENLDHFNIIREQGAPTRSLSNIALDYQRRREVAQSTGEQFIQDQLVHTADNYELNSRDALNLNQDLPLSDEVMTTPQRERLAMYMFGVDTNQQNGIARYFANAGLSAILPGPYTAKMNYVLKKVFPETEHVGGTGIQEAKNILRNLPRRELTERLRLLSDTVEEMSSIGPLEMAHNAVGGKDSVDSAQAWDLYTSFTNGLADTTNDTTAATIQDVVFAMDLLPALGYLGRRGSRAMSYLRRFTPMGRLERANRSAARELAQRVIQEGANSALGKKLKADLGEMVAEHGAVKSPGSGSRGSYSILDDFDESQMPAVSTNYSSSQMTPQEAARFERTQRAQVRRTTTTTARRVAQTQVANTEVGQIPGGLRVAHTLGSSQHAGFHDVRVADAVASSLDDGERLVTVERRNILSGQTDTMTMDQFRSHVDEVGSIGDRTELNAYQRAALEGEQKNYEYFVRSQEDRFIAPEHVLPGQFEAARTGITGWFAKYANKSSLYRRYFANMSTIAEAEADVVTQALRGAREEYSNLNARSMKLADRIIHAMDDQGEDFSLERIVDMADGDIPAVRGVLAVRRWADALHYRENYNFRRRLQAEGYQHLRVTSPIQERTDFLGRAVNEVSDGTSFYDLATKTHVKANKELLQELKTRGVQLVELRRPLIVDRQQVRYVALDAERKLGKLGKLPPNVIARLPGYFPRVYDANYVLARVVSGVDAHGKPYTGRVPISLHHNIDQANRERSAKLALQEGKPDELVVLGSRELNNLQDDYLISSQARGSIDYYEATGRLFTTSRGKLLNPMTEQLGATHRGPLRDIRETMEMAEYKVGNQAITQSVEFLTQRWEKDYAEHFGVVDPATGKKVMPIWGDIPHASDANINKALRDRAIADRDHIQLVAGVDRSWIRAGWAQAMRNVSESLVSRYNPNSFMYRVGDAAIRLRNTSPDSWLRRGAFVTSIAWNPIRQLILQASSAGLYTAAPNFMKYMGTGRFTKDYMAVVTYNLVKDLEGSNKLMDDWAKRLGMSSEEYRTLGESFDRTGFFQSIDSHSYAVGIHNSAFSQAFETSRAATAIGQPFKNFNNFMRRVGFDTGEKHNLLSAWLVQRNEALAEGKDLTNLHNFTQLIGDARARSGNMSRTGSTALNRGAAGVLFQFMTYNMRIAQQLIPKELPRTFGIKAASNFFTRGRAEGWYRETIGKLSDEALTQQEKKRIWLYQSLMWGAGGWGAMGAVNGGLQIISDMTGTPIELNQDVSNIIQEGMIGSGLNLGLRIAMGDNSQVNFSEAFSPVAGFRGNFPGLEEGNSNPAVAIGEAIFLQTPSARQGLGPGVAMLFRAFSSAKIAWAMMGMPVDGVQLDYDPENSPDKALDAIARFAPVYNNFIKGRAAAKIGWMMSNGGDLTVHAERGEAAMRSLLGLESDRERNYLNTRNEMFGVMEQVTPASDRDLRDAAKAYYNYMKISARRLPAGEIDENQFTADVMNHSAMMNDLLHDPIENYNFWNYFQDYVRSDLNERGEMKLVDTLFNRVHKGEIKNNAESITRISNMGDFEGKEDVLNYLKTLTELYPDG